MSCNVGTGTITIRKMDNSVHNYNTYADFNAVYSFNGILNLKIYFHKMQKRLDSLENKLYISITRLE